MAEGPAKTQGFNFSGFQAGFHDVWSFVFPNVLVLLLCIGIASFVGKLNLSPLAAPFSSILIWLKELSKFLNETQLFGSTLVPSLVFVVLAVAALNVFQILRMWIGNIIPRQIIITPWDKFAELEVIRKGRSVFFSGR